MWLMNKEREEDQSCRGVVNLLCDYLEGDIASEESRELEGHMEECPPCLSFLKTYQKTTELCRSLRPGDLPPELKEKLEQMLEKRKSR
jgi:anti-sigma factor RsiW